MGYISGRRITKGIRFMNAEENLILQGLKIEIAALTQTVQGLRVNTESRPRLDGGPEWITLEAAVQMKGGAALATYQSKLFLQPCCGLNYRFIGGRKCWRREEVIRWIGITDADLKNYAAEWRVNIPKNYERRSA
jgi:hypothetical protein